MTASSSRASLARFSPAATRTRARPPRGETLRELGGTAPHSPILDVSAKMPWNATPVLRLLLALHGPELPRRVPRRSADLGGDRPLRSEEDLAAPLHLRVGLAVYVDEPCVARRPARTGQDPAGPDIRDGLQSPVLAGHLGAVPPAHPLQVGLQDRELPDSPRWLEHVAEPLHPADPRQPRERDPHDARMRGRARRRKLDHDVPRGHSFPETGGSAPSRQGPSSSPRAHNRPSCPSHLDGTADALPKRGFLLRGRHAIRVTVLDAIPPTEFADLSVSELTQKVHDLIAARVAN